MASPAKGDAQWLDQQGSYMATVAAGNRCSGCSALRTSESGMTISTPRSREVNVGMLDGQLAWRQHDGGHTDAPNCKYFIALGG